MQDFHVLLDDDLVQALRKRYPKLKTSTAIRQCLHDTLISRGSVQPGHDKLSEIIAETMRQMGWKGDFEE